MKIGKVPSDFLENKLIAKLNKGTLPKEVVIQPSVGEDCAVLKLDAEDYLVLSTDPITGAAENIGELAVHINVNDIASSGGEPIGLLVTLLMPPQSDEEEILKIMSGIQHEVSQLGMAILGGHTEITDGVTRPIVSVTVVGKAHKSHMVASSTAKAGDYVVMTKYAGLEGSAIIAWDYEKQLESLPKAYIEEAKSYTKYLSVLPEGRIAGKEGVHAMHDVTEGGILGACYELAKCSGCGIEVNQAQIPVTEATKAICDLAKVNVYGLISSGSMLIATADDERLIKALDEQGIKATTIGRLTSEQSYWYIDNGKRNILEEPDTDTLYDVNFEN